MTKRKQYNQRKQSRLDHIERKCDRILSELLIIRQQLSRRPVIQHSIGSRAIWLCGQPHEANRAGSIRDTLWRQRSIRHVVYGLSFPRYVHFKTIVSLFSLWSFTDKRLNLSGAVHVVRGRPPTPYQIPRIFPPELPESYPRTVRYTRGHSRSPQSRWSEAFGLVLLDSFPAIAVIPIS